MTYELRGAVLRPNGGEVAWAGDEEPAHVPPGRARGDGAVVGVVRFSPAPARGGPGPGPVAAARDGHRARRPGSGAGRALVVDGLARVADRGGDLVWCDARVAAAGFYERMGFTVVTGEFDKPGIGPHVGMLIEVPAPGGSRSS